MTCLNNANEKYCAVGMDPGGVCPITEAILPKKHVKIGFRSIFVHGHISVLVYERVHITRKTQGPFHVRDTLLSKI